VTRARDEYLRDGYIELWGVDAGRQVVGLDAPQLTVGRDPGCDVAVLGMLTATLERWDEAEGYFEAALALEERMESPPLMARTRYWYARMLLSRNRPGDLERGIDLLARARDSADELGMALLASQVRDVERASSGQP
jgi:hypothetical protein